MEPTKFDLEVGALPADGFDCMQFEDFEKLEDELSSLLARAPAQLPAFGFHPEQQTTHPYTVAQAFGALVDRAGAGVFGRICCRFKDKRAADAVARFDPSAEGCLRDEQHGRVRLQVLLGDLTAVRAGAVVNPSNTSLTPGGGVSYALGRAAGEQRGALRSAMWAKAPLAEGGAVRTPNFVKCAPEKIHVATATGGEAAVKAAAANILSICARDGIQTVSTAAFGRGTGFVPVERLAVHLRAALAAHHAPAPSLVKLVFFHRGEFDQFFAPE